MKKNKTIAIFNGFYLPHLGGVERYTSKIVEILKEKYNIIIISSNFNNDREIYEQDNIKYYKLPTYNLAKNRYPLLKRNKQYKQIVAQIKQEKIDYIICNTRYYQTTLLGCNIYKYLKNLKLGGEKLFIIDHSSNHIQFGNFFVDKIGACYEHYLTHKIKKYNPQFYGVSKRCNEWLLHFNIKASGVFYNSVDRNMFYEHYKEKADNSKIIIGYIGRIIPEKGIIDLLESFNTLRKEYSNIVLKIAGDGPILKDLKEKYKSKDIVFLGKLDYEHVTELCNELDIFVHPSKYPEGLPTSILEAGIMKTAIIATDRGGTIEVIDNKNLGMIIEENINDLTEKLRTLLSNKSLIEQLKNNIHNRIMDNFTWESTVKIIEKELEK